MAKLSVGDVLALARLAKLWLSESEVNDVAEELNQVLGYVERLQDVDVSKLQPTAQVTGLVNVTRPDELIEYQANPEQLMKNVPETENGYIKVKRVIE